MRTVPGASVSALSPTYFVRFRIWMVLRLLLLLIHNSQSLCFFANYFSSKDGGQSRPDTGRIWSILAGHRGPLDGERVALGTIHGPPLLRFLLLVVREVSEVELSSIYVTRHHSNQACVARHSGEIAADAYVTGVQHKSTLPSGETKLKLVLCSGMRCDM